MIDITSSEAFDDDLPAEYRDAGWSFDTPEERRDVLRNPCWRAVVRRDVDKVEGYGDSREASVRDAIASLKSTHPL